MGMDIHMHILDKDGKVFKEQKDVAAWLESLQESEEEGSATIAELSKCRTERVSHAWWRGGYQGTYPCARGSERRKDS